MALVCPQCKQVFEQDGICPLCNVVLLFHAQNHLSGTTPVHEENDSPQWQQTPWGRIIVGLILAQGLSFGFHQLLTAGFLATGDGSTVWGTLWGIVLRHSIHAASLLLGGTLAGAGQARGILYGAMTGLLSGILSLALKHRDGESFNSSLVYLEPIIHLATGAIGGALGMLVWRPVPKLPEFESSTPVPITSTGGWGILAHVFAGPIHVGRVCAGAFVIVMGVVWARAILEFLLRASNGTLTISSQLQAQLVSMEIAALVALIGAAFAGATTRNGLKQGLCVGLGACVIVLGVQVSSPRFTVESLISTSCGILIVAMVGGWFGGELFPPIEAGKRRRRFSAYS